MRIYELIDGKNPLDGRKDMGESGRGPFLELQARDKARENADLAEFGPFWAEKIKDSIFPDTTRQNIRARLKFEKEQEYNRERSARDFGGTTSNMGGPVGRGSEYDY